VGRNNTDLWLSLCSSRLHPARNAVRPDKCASGNTIFITGGGSGIGRGFAEALHGKGNQVIISGRRKSALEEVGRANPGIEFVELDIENPKSRNK
jgi:short-subunit dehydrogenase involved in D-alanine esterification of teichoic acids